MSSRMRESGRDLDASGRAMGYDSIDIQEWPETELGYAFDNRMRPREVTLFNEETRLGRSRSGWISADLEDARAVEDCR